MDAVMFVKEWKRMCRSSKTCLSCSIGKIAGVSTVCSNVVKKEPEKYVAIVEKWSAEHPIKMRQSEFLKMFPNAPLRENGSIAICRLDVDRDARCSQKQGLRCHDRQKEYLLAEVER